MAESFEQAAKTRLDVTLQQVAHDVVNALGYVGAMVATYEKDNSLPVRAVYFDPKVAPVDKMEKWEKRISRMMRRNISITNLDPDFARVFVNDEKYKNNLSVKAVKAGKPVVSDEFFSLFTPIVPAATKPVFKAIQLAFGIGEVIAAPFFLAGVHGREPEIVGNIFAIKESEITDQDVIILTAFGRQAAAAIELERHRVQVLDVAKELTTELQASLHQKEDEILRQIVEGVVSVLGYVGALVSTYEQDDSMTLRVAHLHPELAAIEQVQKWEDRISQMMGRPVSITRPDPDFARVYVHQEKYKDNLSVQAVTAKKPVVSDEMYSLFTPVVPKITKPIFNQMIQQALGVKQVIAVPFFLEPTSLNGEPQIVGNLFAATTKREGFEQEEIELLQAFGKQAAAGIRNARLYREVETLYNKAEEQRREIEELYRKAEEQRQVAEVFGKMAFSAAANVHALRNHVGAFRAHLQILLMCQEDPLQLREILASSPRYIKRLDEAATILDGLHEPWREQSDHWVDVNRALTLAITKANDILNLDGIIQVEEHLTEDLPKVRTSFDMLAEAFRILVKNGMEAILESHGDMGQPTERIGVLRVESRRGSNSDIEVCVQDNGVGIAPDHLSEIFQLRWSTKETGMGFGLFWLKDYIEGLEGKVMVQSTLLEGTTFRVLLPISSSNGT